MLQAKVNHDTQFYRIKGGVGVSPSLSPHLKELMKFYESCSQDDQVQLPSLVTSGFYKIEANAYVRRDLYVSF